MSSPAPTSRTHRAQGPQPTASWSRSHRKVLDRLPDGDGETVDDLIELLLGDDERRREQNEVAVRSIGMADVRPDDEMRVERDARHRLREVNRAGEGNARGRIVG